MQDITRKARKILTAKHNAARSAWRRGVIKYAFEMLYDVDERAALPMEPRDLEAEALNGARDWSAFSWGGCSLIYDEDVARRLCTPSELKRTKNGERRPNSREAWLDVQARALFQAFRVLKSALTEAEE